MPILGGTSASSSVTLAERGAWATATVYSVGDVVTQASIRYVCKTGHTAGTFSTDLAALRWTALDPGAAVPLATSGQVPAQEPVAFSTVAAVGSLAYAARADHVHPAAGMFGLFGNGTWGSVTFDGSTAVTNFTRVGSVYTQTGPNFSNFYPAANVTINAGVTVIPSTTWLISGTLTVNGTLSVAGGNASGATAGTAGRFASAGAAGGTGAGAASSTPSGAYSSKVYMIGGSGGSASGGGTAGGSGGGGGSLWSGEQAPLFDLPAVAQVGYFINAAANPAFFGAGQGGGAGAGDGVNAGGGGGGGGGALIVNARVFAGSGVLDASGGAGAAGTGGNAGGGGAGGGGFVIVNTGDRTGWTGTIYSGTTPAPGKGTGGAGSGTGTAGGTGSASGAIRGTFTFNGGSAVINVWA